MILDEVTNRVDHPHRTRQCKVTDSTLALHSSRVHLSDPTRPGGSEPQSVRFGAGRMFTLSRPTNQEMFQIRRAKVCVLKRQRCDGQSLAKGGSQSLRVLDSLGFQGMAWHGLPSPSPHSLKAIYPTTLHATNSGRERRFVHLTLALVLRLPSSLFPLPYLITQAPYASFRHSKAACRLHLEVGVGLATYAAMAIGTLCRPHVRFELETGKGF